MSDLQRAVAELMKAWPDLDDVDRAVRVKQLRDAGASGRALAQAVGCSEGLIRQLRMAADATDDEKQQARLGELSTRQLIENVRARRKEQEAINRADLKSESQLAAQKAATTIVSWLGSELSSSYAEQVLDEANHMLAAAEREGKLPKDKAPDGMSVEEIIARWRPKNLLDDEPGGTYEGDIYLARYADWLFRRRITCFLRTKCATRPSDWRPSHRVVMPGDCPAGRCPCGWFARGKHSAPSRTLFRWRTKSVRLSTGTVFAFRPERCSGSQRNGVRLHSGIAFTFDRIPHV